MLLGDGILNVLLDFSDVIATIIPEMEPCIGFEQNNKYHQYTVYEHIAHAVANYKGTDVSVKVALLLHDIGKPQCYTEDENGGHFHGHGVPSRDIAEQVLDRLRFDNKTKQEVLELVLYHDTMIEPTPRTVRKWLHKLGERRFLQFLDVRMADILAHAEGTQESRIERCIALGSIMSEVLEAEQCFALKDLQINGRDIMSLGIEQGKRVGEILNSLLDLSLENEPEWIRPASSIIGKLATFDLIAAVGDVDAVTAVIDPEAVATVSEVERMLEAHNSDPNAHGGGIGHSSGVVHKEITIPTVGWNSSENLDDAEDRANGELYLDISVADITADLTPDVILHKSACETAKAAGLSTASRALEGALRLWAQEIPSAEMAATIVRQRRRWDLRCAGSNEKPARRC